MKAIGEAAREGHRKCSYVEGILRNWEKDRLFSLSLVEGHLKAWEEKNVNKSQPRQPQKSRFADYKGREWDYVALERMAAGYATAEAGT